MTTQLEHADTGASSVKPRQRFRFRIRALLGLLLLLALGGWGLGELALWRASTCLESRNHVGALRWLQAASWVRPRSAELHFLLARTYRRLERFSEVPSELQKASDLGWKRSDLEREQWLALAQTGQYQEIRNHWSQLFSDARSDGPEICKAFVVAALKRFQVRDALKVIASWKADFPEDPEPYVQEARIAAVGLKWKDVEDAYRQARQRAPRRLDIQQGLIEALMKQLKLKEADEELQKLLELDPTNLEAQVNRADCLIRLGSIEIARGLLKNVLNGHPEKVSAMVLLGQLELSDEHPKTAVDVLRRAVDRHPEDAEVRYLFARALQAAGRPDEAKSHFQFRERAREPLIRLQKAVNELVQKPTDRDLRYEVAELTWRWKSHDEGAVWAMSLLESAPDDRQAHALLAHHFELKHDEAKAAMHRNLAGSVEFHE